MSIIVFYDGHCGMCNRFVTGLLTRDRGRGTFHFAPLQGTTAQKLLPEAHRRAPFDSVVVLQSNKVFTHSAAVLCVLRQLGGIYRWVWLLALLVPRPLRDGAYRILARNRHRIWKTAPACLNLSPAERAFFLP